MKKKIMLSLCLAGCVMSSAVPSYIYAETEESQKEITEEKEEAAELEMEEQKPLELSNDLYSFSLQMGEVIYQFPMTYTEFVEAGAWTASSYYVDQEEDLILPNSYTFMGFENGGNKISVDVINFDINAVPMADCYVGGIDIDANYDFKADKLEVTLPGGLKLGAATLEEIQDAYGTPSDTYDGDLYTKLTYEKDLYEEVSLYVYKKDNLLKEIEIRNLQEPEGFVYGEVSTEVPEIVTAYQTPKALTDDLTDPIVEFMGDLYQLPAPVTAFIRNGWEIQNADENDYVRGGGMAFIDMMRDNQKVHLAIYNDLENATLFDNCMIHELSFQKGDSENIAMKLSGQVVLGADSDTLMAAARENEYYVKDEIEENGYLTIAKDEDVKSKNYVEFWVDTEEDAVAVAGMTIHCENAAE